MIYALLSHDPGQNKFTSSILLILTWALWIGFVSSRLEVIFWSYVRAFVRYALQHITTKKTCPLRKLYLSGGA